MENKKLHAEVSKFVNAFEKKIPMGVNDQIIRDHLHWIKRQLQLLESATPSKPGGEK